MLSPNMWPNELASGRLVQLFPIVVIEGLSYWLVYPEHKRNQAKIRAFRDWILAETAIQAAGGPAEVSRPAGVQATGAAGSSVVGSSIGDFFGGE